MSEKASTGFVNAMNTEGCVKTFMANGIIAIFGGATQPANADAAETGTLLMLLTLNGGAFVAGISTNGINMDVSTDGILAKSATEVWQGVGLPAAGPTGMQATWFRWYDNNYVTGASSVAKRYDGAIGTTTSFEMRMSNTVIVEGGPSTATSFNFNNPKSA